MEPCLLSILLVWGVILPLLGLYHLLRVVFSQALALACSSCGATLRQRDRFCWMCGAPVAGQGASRGAGRPVPVGAEPRAPELVQGAPVQPSDWRSRQRTPGREAAPVFPETVPPASSPAGEAGQPAVASYLRTAGVPPASVAEKERTAAHYLRRLQELLRQRNIQLGELIASAIILVCSVAFVVSIRDTLASVPALQVALFGAVPLVFMGAAAYTRRRWETPVTTEILSGIGHLLLPPVFLLYARIWLTTPASPLTVLTLLGSGLLLLVALYLTLPPQPGSASGLYAAGLIVPAFVSVLCGLAGGSIAALVAGAIPQGEVPLWGFLFAHSALATWVVHWARGCDEPDKPHVRRMLCMHGLAAVAVLGILLALANTTWQMAAGALSVLAWTCIAYIAAADLVRHRSTALRVAARTALAIAVAAIAGYTSTLGRLPVDAPETVRWFVLAGIPPVFLVLTGNLANSSLLRQAGHWILALWAGATSVSLTLYPPLWSLRIFPYLSSPVWPGQLWCFLNWLFCLGIVLRVFIFLAALVRERDPLTFDAVDLLLVVGTGGMIAGLLGQIGRLCLAAYGVSWAPGWSPRFFQEGFPMVAASVLWGVCLLAGMLQRRGGRIWLIVAPIPVLLASGIVVLGMFSDTVPPPIALRWGALFCLVLAVRTRPGLVPAAQSLVDRMRVALTWLSDRLGRTEAFSVSPVLRSRVQFAAPGMATLIAAGMALLDAYNPCVSKVWDATCTSAGPIGVLLHWEGAFFLGVLLLFIDVSGFAPGYAVPLGGLVGAAIGALALSREPVETWVELLWASRSHPGLAFIPFLTGGFAFGTLCTAVCSRVAGQSEGRETGDELPWMFLSPLFWAFWGSAVVISGAFGQWWPIEWVFPGIAPEWGYVVGAAMALGLANARYTALKGRAALPEVLWVFVAAVAGLGVALLWIEASRGAMLFEAVRTACVASLSLLGVCSAVAAGGQKDAARRSGYLLGALALHSVALASCWRDLLTAGVIGAAVDPTKEPLAGIAAGPFRDVVASLIALLGAAVSGSLIGTRCHGGWRPLGLVVLAGSLLLAMNRALLPARAQPVGVLVPPVVFSLDGVLLLALLLSGLRTRGYLVFVFWAECLLLAALIANMGAPVGEQQVQAGLVFCLAGVLFAGVLAIAGRELVGLPVWAYLHGLLITLLLGSTLSTGEGPLRAAVFAIVICAFLLVAGAVARLSMTQSPRGLIRAALGVETMSTAEMLIVGGSVAVLQLALAVVVLLLGVESLTQADRLRLTGKTLLAAVKVTVMHACVLQAAGLALLAVGRHRFVLQVASLVMAGVGAAVAIQGVIPGEDPVARWGGVSLVFWCVGFLECLGLNRLGVRGGDWVPAGRWAALFHVVVAALVNVALVVRAAVGPQHVAGFWQSIAPAIGLVMGMVALLLLALLPGADPLDLSPRRKTLYVYIAELIGCLLVAHLYFEFPEFFGRIPPWVTGLALLGLAVVGATIGEVFQRRKVTPLADALDTTSTLMPVVAVASQLLLPGHTEPDVVAVLAAFSYGMLAVLRGQWSRFWYVYVSLGLAYVLFLDRRFPDLWSRHVQVVVWPLVAIALVVVELHGKELRREVRSVVRGVVLTVGYLAGVADVFVQSLGTSWWGPVLFLLVSVTTVILGLWLRILGYVTIGGLGVAVALLAITWHAYRVTQFVWIWYLSGLLLGMAMFVVFGWLERSRDLGEKIRLLSRWEF